MIRGIGSELVYIGWQFATEVVATLSGRRLDRTLKAPAPLGRGCRHWRLLPGKRKSHRQTVRRFRSQDGVLLMPTVCKLSVTGSDAAQWLSF